MTDYFGIERRANERKAFYKALLKTKSGRGFYKSLCRSHKSRAEADADSACDAYTDAVYYATKFFNEWQKTMDCPDSEFHLTQDHPRAYAWIGNKITEAHLRWLSVE